MTRSGNAQRLAAVILALGLFGTLSLAQQTRPPLDPLSEAQARQKIADQKAEVDVRAAIQDAERLPKGSAAKAVRILKAAQDNLDVSAALSSEARKNLTLIIAAKIALIEGRPLPEAGSKPDPLAPSLKHDKKAAFESSTAELKAINDGIQRIVKLKQAGLNKDADHEIAALAKSYPNNPSVIRLQEQDNFSSRVEDALEFARQQDKRITLAFNDVMRSSLPAIGDIEFPKDWKEKTKRRMTDIRLSEKERKIIEALNKPVTVDWNGKNLEEALQELSNLIDQNLFIDKKSLSDLLGGPGDLTLAKPVTLQAKGLSARTVLRQILAAQGLTFVVKDEAIQVVTVDKARDLLVTRVYYLGDLAQGVGPFSGVTAGPFLNFQQTMLNVDVILKSIQNSVDPLCWKANGGPCTITFHYPSMSIIVRASSEVHSSLGSTFGAGR
jgi:hypothetical protein